MASWILVPCLVSLRNEFNKLAPSRDKASDGSIGDTSHAAGASDHNPDETGNTPSEDADNINEVHAIDVDTDLKKPGWNMQKCVDIIVGNHRAGRDNRLQNVIYNRRIASASWGWTWRDYTGTSPHTEHAHFSARYTTAQEKNTSPWGLLEEDGVSKQDVIDALKSSEGRAALADAILDMHIRNKAYPTRTFENFVNDIEYKRDYEIGDGAGAKYAGVKPGSYINILSGVPATLRTLSTAIQAIAKNVAADDQDLPTIMAKLDEIAKAQEGVADEVLSAGLGQGETDEEAAQRMLAIYGPQRAAAIAQLVTSEV
ncbi:hypothetical protein [Winogradskya humida]|uniref:Uncharacterized protein n=1 Tax=Winogradskya humida TaxID=113566 RepID=A0ABQ3ZGS5_9ACTN|nr:hypothetical protein [Actinoplanes humidus]GIE17775.1 hypothetical protein Ahu01nite_008770 [Actinoplanes humidus]